MAVETSTPENAEAENVQGQIEGTIDQIEKQEVKVDNARSEAEEKKEGAALKSLLDKYDSLLSRLESIDKRLAEPTVPAPEAKKDAVTELPPVDSSAGKGVSGETSTKPRKRRLGAWGG